jgi:hypothetical protein
MARTRNQIGKKDLADIEKLTKASPNYKGDRGPGQGVSFFSGAIFGIIWMLSLKPPLSQGGR